MKLNIACGPNLWCGADWIHYDHVDMEQAYLRHIRADLNFMGWNPEQRKLADGLLAGQPLDFRVHDLHQPFPHDNGTIDAIYVGQAIEHLNRRTQAPRFLRECHRMLAPGGRIRLTTPDLQALVNMYQPQYQMNNGFQFERTLGDLTDEQPSFYASALPEDQLSYLLFGASGDGCTQSEYHGHFHCYTRKSLGELMKECGFGVYPHHSKSKDFADCIDKGMSHSFAIEGYK